MLLLIKPLDLIYWKSGPILPRAPDIQVRRWLHTSIEGKCYLEVKELGCQMHFTVDSDIILFKLTWDRSEYYAT